MNCCEPFPEKLDNGKSARAPFTAGERGLLSFAVVAVNCGVWSLHTGSPDLPKSPNASIILSSLSFWAFDFMKAGGGGLGLCNAGEAGVVELAQQLVEPTAH